MEVTEFLEREGDAPDEIGESGVTPAAGLFGYSIFNGRMSAFKPTVGYVCKIEQMPNFAPPSADSFVARYVKSNITKTEDSS